MPVFLAAFSYLAFLLLLPFVWSHPKLRQGRRARLGHYGAAFLATARRRPIWLHGASAGDILALLPTARALKRLLPNVPIVASTLTNSGYAMAQKYADVFDQVTYSPWDLPHVARRAMKRIRPRLLVLEYTELWPQLMAAARAAQVPVVLHNGRFGGARLGRYRALFVLTGNLLRGLRLLLLRDGRERERALLLGARAHSLVVTGNTKFDNLGPLPSADEVAALRRHSGFGEGVPVWTLGSTHEGEEEALLGIFRRLRLQIPELKVVLAPRYPERAHKLVALAQRLQLRPRLRMPCPGLAQAAPPAPARPAGGVPTAARALAAPDACDVFILNSLGELRAAYCLATVVFVGGSFVPRGGQNILEPAACGRPVLFGPRMENFADAVGVLLGRGGLQVASFGQLERVLCDWLQRPQRCASLGRLGQNQVRRIRGAAERNAQYLARLAASG